MKISVLGAGAWGTALAIHLGKLYPTKLWARNSGHASGMKKAQSNPLYLGDFKFPALLEIEDSFEKLKGFKLPIQEKLLQCQGEVEKAQMNYLLQRIEDVKPMNACGYFEIGRSTLTSMLSVRSDQNL